MLAIGLCGSAAANILYTFDNGAGAPDWQGWTLVSQNSGDPKILVANVSERSYMIHRPCITTRSGTVDGGFAGDASHPPLIARSPSFKITGSPITFESAGGNLSSLAPNLGTGDYSSQVMGVALVRASDGARVASVRTGSQDVAPTMRSNTLDTTDYVDDGTDYYLEAVDTFSGGWGFIEWDTFSIPGTLPPQMQVQYADNTVATGGTDAGLTQPGTGVQRQYTIRNFSGATGTLMLTGTPVVVLTGDSQFTLTSDVPAGETTLAPGASTSFQISFAPAAVGTYTAQVSIANNDATKNPYTVTISMNVTPLLAYEHLDYPTGNLTGQNGGTGWSGAWNTVNNGSGTVLAGNLLAETNAPSGYDINSVGNSLNQPNGTRTGRFLDTSASGPFGLRGYLNGSGNIGADGKTLYISFMQQPSTTSFYYEFEFHRDDLGDGGRIGGIGNDTGTTNVNLRAPNSINNLSLGAGSTAVNFYVVRIDFKDGNDDIRVYRNSTSDTEPDTPTLTALAQADMSFDGISFGAFVGATTVKHDEIRIGETWADVVPPAPATTFDITATAGTGGSISPSGVATVARDATPTYTITADIGYDIADVVLDGTTHLGAVNTYTFSAVTANRTIAATLVEVSPHTITASADTHGSISPSGTASVAHHDSQFFTITPDTGFVVLDVVVDGVTQLGSVTSYTFANVQADHTISATFVGALTYDFNDGTFQGWQVLSQGGGPNLLVGASEANRITTSPCLTTARTIAGGAFTGDNAHAIIIARSPDFTINAGAIVIKWTTVGGNATNTVDPGTGTDAYPTGAMGVSLVETAMGNRIMSSRLNGQEPATTKSFDVSALANNGTNYHLEIVDNFSGSWGYGEWDNFVIPGTLATPSAPTGLSAMPGNARVLLTWAATPGATTYNVKRSQTSSGAFTLVGTTTATDYLDTTAVNGTPCYYVVSAANTTGESDNSTQADATPNILPLPSGTAVYYSFNDAANPGRDDSGNGQHLQATTGTPQHDTGGYGGALLLDGATTLGTVSGSFPTGVPTGASPFTVACFVKADPSGSALGGWIGYGSGADRQTNNFRMDGYFGGVHNYWWNADISAAVPNGGDFRNAWHAVVGTWDGTTRKIYIDGLLQASDTPGDPAITTANFRVGTTLADENFKGWIDELLIVNRALTAAEAGAYALGGYAVGSLPQPGNYAAWAAANGGSADPTADSNHNGVPDGVEFFLGGTAATPATLPPLVDNAGTWTWAIPYDPTAAASHVFQSSDDLTIWFDAAPGDIQTLTSPDRIVLTLPSGTGKKFCRLLVTPN